MSHADRGMFGTAASPRTATTQHERTIGDYLPHTDERG